MIDAVTQISLIPRDTFLHRNRQVSGELRSRVHGVPKQPESSWWGLAHPRPNPANSSGLITPLIYCPGRRTPHPCTPALVRGSQAIATCKLLRQLLLQREPLLPAHLHPCPVRHTAPTGLLPLWETWKIQLWETWESHTR